MRTPPTRRIKNAGRMLAITSWTVVLLGLSFLLEGCLGVVLLPKLDRLLAPGLGLASKHLCLFAKRLGQPALLDRPGGVV